MLRRHGGTQSADLQRPITGSARALSELVGREQTEATVAVVGAPVVFLLADPVGRQTPDSGSFTDIR